MAAIIVYKKKVNDTGRQVGMADFGKHLRIALDDFASSGADLDVNAIQKIFRDAFQHFIPTAGNPSDYIVKFESAVPGEERLFIIRAKINSNSRLKLDLSLDGTTYLRKLRLVVSIDDLDNAERKMHVAVPHKADGTAFDYLNSVVKDVDILAPTLDRAVDYMITTNFFTRCA